jgi:3-oxoacid CoA-transferase
MHGIRRALRRGFSVKIFENSVDAVEDIRNGSRIAIGGYGACGVPENSIRALHNLGTYDLTAYTATTGVLGWGLDLLIRNKQIKRLITSHSGFNTTFNKQYMAGEVELELIPEGSLAARLYAGGAGIPAIYTKTGVGTVVEEGQFPIKYMPGGHGVEIYSGAKEKRRFRSQDTLMEEGITTEYSLIKAWKGDTKGNLVFRRTAANFNTTMAQCARVTIAEVEQIVPEGELDPDDIHVPAVYVHRLFKGEFYEKPIEHLTLLSESNKLSSRHTTDLAHKLRIARRAAKEIEAGMTVHLGLGIAGLIAHIVDPKLGVMFHSNSGAMGVGDYPKSGLEDADVINSSRETVTLLNGASCFSSNESMDIVRGGHVDLNIISGFQVSQYGDLANWYLPGKFAPSIGANMDVVSSEKTKNIVTMMHTMQSAPKIVKECTLPLTGKKCVHMLITEKGVFDFTRENTLTLVEIAKDVRLNEIREVTGCNFNIASDLKPMD